MKYQRLSITDHPLFNQINKAWLVDETEHVHRLLATTDLPDGQRQRIADHARSLVTHVRKHRASGSGVDAFMHEYQLSSQEGVVLMCLAEALLRIPDEDTVDLLIRDKLCGGNWEKHLGNSESLFVNASTWGLMLSGKMIGGADGQSVFKRLLLRSGEPLIRQAVRQAMRIMARQFVMGRTVSDALKRAKSSEKNGYTYSYDMLGEAARTDADSQRYFDAYRKAINTIGKAENAGNPVTGPGISIKLSALHPRYEFAQADRVMAELLPKLEALALLAKRYNIGLTIDAEEADRLDLSLCLLDSIARNPDLAGWNGLGLAVQAYQKRAYDLIDWLADLARQSGRQLMIRLVKGAYWDTEIKRAQERGLSNYPVFTRKVNTDVSYLACAKKLLGSRDLFYPQFATHNAHTVAAILEMANDCSGFEFQRLHGMGEPLYAQLVTGKADSVPCRVYAPVGSHEDLLPYLVRRLLENGANSSFVNRIMDDMAPVDDIIADPLAQASTLPQVPHPKIPLPVNLYPDRRNSSGLELSDIDAISQLKQAMEKASEQPWSASPMTGSQAVEDATVPRRATYLYSPTDNGQRTGSVINATLRDAKAALDTATLAAPVWNATTVDLRAACLERMADLLENQMPRFIAMCTMEAGKTIPDGIAEVREAIDFCRYYALQARKEFVPKILAGPTGQLDQWQLQGRGIFVCISPWNFPLAIFLGQVTAALVAGNAVIAKPAEQTPMIAAAAVELLYESGIPRNVLQFLPGDGAKIGAALVKDSRVAGVAFTGSTDTAWAINRSLAERKAPIATLIAETGGLNTMLVDSSALPEQVVADVLTSGFQSAGQRCSALRILLVQQDVAPRLLTMLTGAMAQLRIGDPVQLSTDVGPVIDQDALTMLRRHSTRMQKEARLVYGCDLPEGTKAGTFFPPQLFEISSLEQIRKEVFGPIVHVMRYKAKDLDSIIDAVNAMGYGLTFGIHSRIDSKVKHVISRIKAGNIYVNRNMIGAVVGVQPFGGMGLSGTGPKAGGPHYLSRFTTEQSISHNTTAAGGNASLMSIGD